jgi:pterin-4a-carbinolamine dehydratase
VSHLIFINYRRLDAQADAGRLLSTLQHELGHSPPFLDTSSLAPGTEWPAEIQSALASAETVVVLIGPDWLRAGVDSFGQRPIDSPSDWVRREIETALELRKRIIPVLLRQAKMPPPEVLPASIRPITALQALEIRSAYWDHDLKLLIQQFQQMHKAETRDEQRFDPYPAPPELEFAVPISDEQLSAALRGPLKGWHVESSPLPEDSTQSRIELLREYKFATFQDAITFMHMVAPGCDVANHHPRWENIWRTLRVYLTTWNIGHTISDRDIQLAKYFDSAYNTFPGRGSTPT